MHETCRGLFKDSDFRLSADVSHLRTHTACMRSDTSAAHAPAL